MFGTKQSNSIVGLDLDAGSIAATELGAGGSGEVVRTAIAPLESGIVSEGDVQDSEGLSAALRSFFSDTKLSKTVRLGIANQRVVVRTLRLPLIEDEDELETAIRFQAQDQIPMPLEQAVLDHHVVAREPGPEGERQMDVVAVAARRDMVGALLGAMRRAGLRPVGIDLSAFGMIRALGGGSAAEPGEAPDPATLYCHLGEITNLAVARGSQCLFTRISPFGIESIATRVAERQGIPLDEARETLVDVGLEEPLDGFEPDRELATGVREILREGASKLAEEVRVSLDFYRAQEGAPPVERAVVCGPGSSVPGLAERLHSGLGLQVESPRPPALSGLDDADAARLTVSYGLALKS